MMIRLHWRLAGTASVVFSGLPLAPPLLRWLARVARRRGAATMTKTELVRRMAQGVAATQPQATHALHAFLSQPDPHRSIAHVLSGLIWGVAPRATCRCCHPRGPPTPSFR
jgi:hypothetical protein